MRIRIYALGGGLVSRTGLYSEAMRIRIYALGGGAYPARCAF